MIQIKIIIFINLYIILGVFFSKMKAILNICNY